MRVLLPILLGPTNCSESQSSSLICAFPYPYEFSTVILVNIRVAWGFRLVILGRDKCTENGEENELQACFAIDL